MSEQSAEYDPMSLLDELNEIYSSPEILEHVRALRSISQETTMKRFRTESRIRAVTSIYLSELFGKRGEGTTIEPPIAPKEF